MRNYPRKHKQNFKKIVVFLGAGQKSTREIYDYLNQNTRGMTIGELNNILPRYFIKIKEIQYPSMTGMSHSSVWKNKGENINGEE